MPIHEGKDSKGSYVRWGGSGKKYYFAKGNKKSKAAAYKKAGAQAAAAKHSGYTGNKGDKMLPCIITSNFSPNVRHDRMEGREYLVAPMVMLTEGVHNGSDGPGLYPAEEISKIPQVWNHKPVVVYHPEQNGQMMSACDPIVLSSRKIGVIMNTKYEDGKLKAEAWLEQSRISAVDERVGAAIENNQMMELSTGLYAEKDNTEGTWNDEEYTWVARDFRPDHLALLPDLKGACSIEDGAGFLRLNQDTNKLEKIKISKEDILKMVLNEMSHESVRSLLRSALEAKTDTDNAWIENVFDDFFIYEKEGAFYAQSYSVDDGAVKIEGLPEQVVRVTEYRSLTGRVIGNKNNVQVKGQEMEKDKVVTALIANEKTKWSEEDREELMGLSEKVLEGLSAEPETEEEQKETPTAETPTGNESEKKEEQKEEQKETPTGNEEVTTEDYINQAPPKVREALTNSMRVLDKEKAKLIETITSNEKNEFSKEMLEGKDIDELTTLAKLAAPVVKIDPNNASQASYLGQAPVASLSAEEPLEVPTLNFEKKTA